jgi:hypothetical protein
MVRVVDLRFCRRLLPLLLVLQLAQQSIAAESAEKPAAKTFSLVEYALPAKASDDATPALQRLFVDVQQQGGGLISIPPGNYFLSGKEPIALASNTRVDATGAVFTLPEKLGNQARLTIFTGSNLHDFHWTGGKFLGRCFDPAKPENDWEPNVATLIFALTTTKSTERISFRRVESLGIAGAVISVFGQSEPRSESGVQTYAKQVRVDNCQLLESGRFMWDYGYLWHILIRPDEFTEHERQLPAKYFRNDLVRSKLQAGSGDRLIRFDNAKVLPVAKEVKPSDVVVFFGGDLPKNIQRGKQYFIVESQPEGIKVAEQPGGQTLVLDGPLGPDAKLIHNQQAAYHALYAPLGGGSGKGAVDLVACEDVRLSNCQLSARGDTMHIQKSRNIVVANNQILGSRMGAFFLAEYCSNATVTGNTIDGTNGSRVMSIEKSCRDVTITGNTFRNGGRGSWINQPTNFILSGNVFVNNTTKAESDPKRGRRTYLTGEFEVYPELYFTLHKPDGEYGSVIVKDNVFETGPACVEAITFAKNGTGIIVKDNIVKGPGRKITVDPTCKEVVVEGNLGAK